MNSVNQNKEEPNIVIGEQQSIKKGSDGSIKRNQPEPPVANVEREYGRLVLTTYPGQAGVDPLPLNWYAAEPKKRGPVLVSRENLRYRNAIGAYSGSYCIYHALAVASGALPTNHRPDYSNTEPTFKIGPHPAWSTPGKIVSMDPWGHIASFLLKDDPFTIEKNLDIRPTIALTRAHLKIPELEGKLTVDGKIVLNREGELEVAKAAVEPVWYLPGVAERFNINEEDLRRILFEDTGGMYPELVTRPDLKVFLPPIGGLTVYAFGDLNKVNDPNAQITVRIHDECNGSDVFGSDICTCRPYLIYGIKLAVETAQKGGLGLIVYYRKEGRALGEVVKYLVYNARKRQEGGDTAENYFKRTESVAGVKDMRFQALMPDVLHWLGVSHIDRLVSMSNMKYEAILASGITVKDQVPLPKEWMPDESSVEIAAKIADGYFAGGLIPEAVGPKGRQWDDINH